jgi:hypothetical protein
MDEARIASIKLVSGEELLCLLVDIVEGSRFTSVLIQKPMLLSKNTSRRTRDKTYQISNWLVADDPTRDFYEINIDKIIITTVITDSDIIDEYKKLFTPELKAKPKMIGEYIGSDLGYIGTVDEYRVKLEHIYNMDSYKKNN